MQNLAEAFIKNVLVWEVCCQAGYFCTIIKPQNPDTLPGGGSLS